MWKLEWYKMVFIGILAAVVLYFLYQIRMVFAPVLFGIVIAYITHPLVMHLEKKDVPRVAAIIVIYLAIVVSVVLLVLFIIPIVSAELDHLTDVVAIETERTRRVIDEFYDQYSRITMPNSVRSVVDQAIRDLGEIFEATLSRAAAWIIELLSQIILIVLAPILAFYFTRDLEVIKETVCKWLPKSRRNDVVSLISEIGTVVGGFVRGQLLIALIIAIMTTIGLLIIGIDFALILGIIAGLSNIIPYFGPIIGSIPAFIVAAIDNPRLWIYILLLYFGIQQVESSLISPYIVGSRVNLHPISVILALLIGGQLMGVVGMLLAVPVTAIGKVILTRTWLRTAEHL